jgi:hypothetical protein
MKFCKFCGSAMKKIGTYMNIAILFCDRCDRAVEDIVCVEKERKSSLSQPLS